MYVLSIVPLIIVACGSYLHICLKFCFTLHPFRVVRQIFKSLESPASRRTLALSLAGTLGVGNIIGVAVGIALGGAGSVLWLVLSAFFSITIKYAEAALSSDIREGNNGGMMYIIKKCFAKHGSSLSVMYAFLCLLLAFFMGAALQTSSAMECIKEIDGDMYIPISLLFVTLVAIVIYKGISKIEGFTAIAIPIASLLYICLCISVILLNYYKIPTVLIKVWKSAFSFQSFGGGIIGFISSGQIREGFLRGMLSNEAGAGTSTIAHARNFNTDPVSVGVIGVTEVIFDTVILCSFTALAILVSIPNPELYKSGVDLILDSIGSLFAGAMKPVISFLILIFAFSTVICWYYYGAECYRFLFGKLSMKLYFLLFLLSVCMGCFGTVEVFVFISDYIFLALSLLTVITVIKNSDRLVRLSEKGGLIKPHR